MKVNPLMFAYLIGIGLIVSGIAGLSAISAAPPRPAAKSRSKKVAEEVLPEIPAVAYVTLGLIRDPAIHEELKLTPKQIEAVQSAISEVDEPFWRLRDVPVQNCSAELNELLAKLQSNLRDELSSSQLDRFDQIVLQARSWKAVVTLEVANRLKLSADQVSKLRTLLAKAARNREESEIKLAAESAENQASTRAKLLKSEAKGFSEVLSTKQQQELGTLLGEPFDLTRVTPVGCVAPELREVSAWINSRPLTLQELRGKVVVIHFWAFGCINCIRNLPHYQGWHERFADSGLTIIGIQTPETAAERSLENLRRQVMERKIQYPVIFDAESKNWKAWGNEMWPSVYLIDKRGRVRNWWYGELNWNGATGEEFLSRRIEALLAEN